MGRDCPGERQCDRSINLQNTHPSLERVLSDADEWEYFAQAGQQRVLKTYTWESTAENYLTLLEQILSSGKIRDRAELLPIHPYFRNPELQTDVSLEELSDLYFGTNQKVVRNAD
ncbi:glycosyltransferase [Nostoc sp.]|uniref:glycosyltransferase n=1 Tax=Nostoc sp. TaxID=1180 RepID=UPI002FF9D503